MIQSPDIQRILYEEDAAPFGQMELIRTGPHLPGSAAIWSSVYCPAMVRESWMKSEWLQGSLEEGELEELAADLTRHRYAVGISKSLFGSNKAPYEQVWQAVPTQRPLDELPVLRGLPQRVLAYGHAKLDVSGGRIARTVKRLAVPAKTYAMVSDVDVLPGAQGHGLGTAVFDACLSGFDSKRKPTTYVMQPNPRLIGTLGSLGFEVTGEQDRTDLIEGVTLREARLQADSVGNVRGRLHESFPWLANSQVIVG